MFLVPRRDEREWAAGISLLPGHHTRHPALPLPRGSLHRLHARGARLPTGSGHYHCDRLIPWVRAVIEMGTKESRGGTK